MKALFKSLALHAALALGVAWAWLHNQAPAPRQYVPVGVHEAQGERQSYPQSRARKTGITAQPLAASRTAHEPDSTHAGTGLPASALQSYLAAIRSRIQSQLQYPLSLQRQGITGTVELRLSISPTGELLDTQVAATSGRGELDQLAQDAVRRVFPAKPPGPTRTITLKVPVEFRLR